MHRDALVLSLPVSCTLLSSAPASVAVVCIPSALVCPAHHHHHHHTSPTPFRPFVPQLSPGVPASGTNTHLPPRQYSPSSVPTAYAPQLTPEQGSVLEGTRVVAEEPPTQSSLGEPAGPGQACSGAFAGPGEMAWLELVIHLKIQQLVGMLG